MVAKDCRAASTCPRHEVVLEGHHDDVQSNDACVCQVEILAAYERVKNHSWLRIVTPVGRLTQYYTYQARDS